MYRQQGSWEDALRVAKVLGGLEAAKKVRKPGRDVQSTGGLQHPCLALIRQTWQHTLHLL